MAATLLGRIDRLRFDAPLAATLGLAAAFAVAAMPPGTLGGLPAPDAAPWVRIAAALAAALVAGGVAYAALRLAGGAAASPAALWEPDLTVAALDEPIAAPAASVILLADPASVRTRRADRHPDAPRPQPILAARDLGRPFMDVDAVVPPPSRFLAAERAATPPRDDLPALVDRFAAGVERRGGRPPARFAQVRLVEGQARQRTTSGDLRRALDELNRLAAAHG